MLTSDTSHPLRPTDSEAARIWDIAAQVPDPEIPVISIADLGILRAARLDKASIADQDQDQDQGTATAVAVITPTYSGCPAMDTITDDVVKALKEAGYDNAKVELVLNPAWSTDWITERGRQNLQDYGIAPPTGRSAHSSSGPVPIELGMPTPVPCPHCHSTETRKISQFGSTSCKALYTCQACFEPFDYFKVH